MDGCCFYNSDISIFLRYVRILQTRGKEKFTIRLESCSYVGPVPYNFRELGVIGKLSIAIIVHTLDT